jgi:hypothetical protein
MPSTPEGDHGGIACVVWFVVNLMVASSSSLTLPLSIQLFLTSRCTPPSQFLLNTKAQPNRMPGFGICHARSYIFVHALACRVWRDPDEGRSIHPHFLSCSKVRVCSPSQNVHGSIQRSKHYLNNQTYFCMICLWNKKIGSFVLANFVAIAKRELVMQRNRICFLFPDYMGFDFGRSRKYILKVSCFQRNLLPLPGR